QASFLVVVAGAIPEMRLGDAGGQMAADQPAGGIFTLDVVTHQILGDDDIAFHADHLGHVGDTARAVAQAGSLDDDVNRAGNDFTYGLGRQGKSAHGDHR